MNDFHDLKNDNGKGDGESTVGDAGALPHAFRGRRGGNESLNRSFVSELEADRFVHSGEHFGTKSGVISDG